MMESQPEIRLLSSDVVMPGGINGYQLAERVTASRPGLGVLLATGYVGLAMSQYNASPFNEALLGKSCSQHRFARGVRRRLDV